MKTRSRITLSTKLRRFVSSSSCSVSSHMSSSRLNFVRKKKRRKRQSSFSERFSICYAPKIPLKGLTAVLRLSK